MEIKNKNILITGGAGFIGFHLAKTLLKKNKVYLWDNLSRGKYDNELKSILRNKNVFFSNINLDNQIKNKTTKFDYVFHLAGSVGVQNIKNKSLKSFLNNIKSTINLLNFVFHNNKKIKFILFSTSEVYSNLIKKKKVKFPISEENFLIIDNEVIDRDSYFLSKIFNEKLLQLSKLKTIILRPHNIYGPRMGLSHVIPELIVKILKEQKKSTKSTTVFSPSHKRAFCFIDDAIKQIVLLARKKNLKRQIYNIGNMKEEIKMFNLAKKIRKLVFNKAKLKKGKITEGSPPRRVPDMKRTLGEIEKIKFTNLDQGLKITYNWYKKNEKKFN